MYIQPKVTVDIATVQSPGIVKPDGDTITIDNNGTINTNFEGWTPKSWNISPFYGYYIWTDGTDIYDSEGNSNKQFVLNRTTGNWDVKTWNGISNIDGIDTWTDGVNMYYSSGTTQKVLDTTTSTWSDTTWNGLASFSGMYIWTDGENIYYSQSNKQYILNKSTSTWSAVTWNGYTSIDGQYVWTDGTDIYYSNYANQYVLDKATNTWSVKTWNGYSNLKGSYVWKMNNEIYYSDNNIFKVLDKTTSTWKDKVWNGLTESFYGVYIWSDGTNTYYSYHDMHYKYAPDLNGFLDDKQSKTLSSPVTVGGAIQNTVEGAISALSSYLEQTVTLSTSSDTVVTFTDSSITTSSCIEVGTSVWGIIPSDVTVTAGVCTVTIPKTDSAQSIIVRIYVR